MIRICCILLVGSFILVGCETPVTSSPGAVIDQTPSSAAVSAVSPTIGPSSSPIPATVAPATHAAIPTQSSPARPTPVRVSPLPVQATLAPQPTLPAPTGTLPLSTEWQTVEWEGLIIPIPPQGQWWSASLENNQSNGIPVLASGGITYPTITGTVELPFGPNFYILQFTGTLDDWLDLERRNSPPGNPVQDETIRDMTIAGRPAKAYQHAITGTGEIEDYILKLTNGTLLWISSENASYEIDRQVIDGLVVKQ